MSGEDNVFTGLRLRLPLLARNTAPDLLRYSSGPKTKGAKRRSRGGPPWAHLTGRRGPRPGRAALWGGAHTPLASSLSRTSSSENLSSRRIVAKSHTASAGRKTREKRALRQAEIRRGNSLPEGEIDAIVTVIELDIISITITIISINITAISTAAPHHRCNNLAYIEKTPFPAKMKEYSIINNAVNKSEKKPVEPEEQIKVEPAVAIVKDLVTENVEDGHIIFCEDASNIVSHPNKSKKTSVPMLSVRIGDHCYYGLCDIGASISAIPYELYTEIMHEIGSCELEDIDVVIQLANRETISPIGIVRDVEVLCEVSMDDFSVYGNSFDNCLRNLDKVLQSCEETNVVLNWEKCHFMVNEGIVLGHKISERGIEVDRAKVEAIEKMPYPRDVKGIRSVLGHAGFYRRFIKDFSKISKPLTNLLQKDKALTTAPIVEPPDWNLPFQIMCDASDFAVGVVLGQRVDKKLNVIHYANRKGADNPVADNLSRLENIAYDPVPVNDSFPNEQLAVIKFCSGSRSIMSSSGTPKDSFFEDVVNPYVNELKMHPKEFLLVDGELQIKDVQGPKGEGSLEDRMEKLEQEVFNYKKMAEREVDIFHKIVAELIDGHKKETSKLWDDILSLHDTTNKLQAQLYDVQNQNCEYENRFKHISYAASFRIPETKMSFVDGEPLPWKSDDGKSSPPPPKE
ncbi:hypothetical protein QYE76_036628 [Lolium multiflorum]|uniref:Reverse transcriptase/retrotransposon-derived protein RNase H-like domain-containing protein n=1 Tax=Lolium multiflorum TaxID=4521 RepID=A0AAD8R2T6_LOLMU|nr:hypothetical protein QYE76_036628 [Lolium multiflorum]